MAKEVTIKIRAFPYYKPGVDPVSGQEVRYEKIARRGDTVELEDADYERAVRFDAILSEADAEVAETTGAFDFQTATSVQLSEYIKKEKPTVDFLVDEVNENPELAARVIEAETLATGNQPRTTLIEKLSDIVAGA